MHATCSHNFTSLFASVVWLIRGRARAQLTPCSRADDVISPRAGVEVVDLAVATMTSNRGSVPTAQQEVQVTVQVVQGKREEDQLLVLCDVGSWAGSWQGIVVGTAPLPSRRGDGTRRCREAKRSGKGQKQASKASRESKESRPLLSDAVAPRRAPRVRPSMHETGERLSVLDGSCIGVAVKGSKRCARQAKGPTAARPASEL